MLEKGLIINLQGAIASKPYILMTLSILDKLGIKNKFENNKISSILFHLLVLELFLHAKKIDNLIATIDLNGKQIDGSTDDVLSMGNLKNKFEAFDWLVVEINDGNNIDQIRDGILKAKDLTKKGKPVCVLLKTMMGNGVDFMMHTHAWHGKAPNDEQLEVALSQNKETIGDY